MEKSLAERVHELEKENLQLKKELEDVKVQTYGWENLKILIKDSLSELNLEKTRPHGCFKGKIQDGIAVIIRETLDLKLIRNLGTEDYDKAKEITDTILALVKKHFYPDRFWCREDIIAKKEKEVS